MSEALNLQLAMLLLIEHEISISYIELDTFTCMPIYHIYAHIYSLRHRKCSVRGYMHELFVSKTRTSEVRASEGF